MEKNQKQGVSVVVRTLNEEENIGKCLLALDGQTLPPTEVLIVDNKSTDKTLEIAESFVATSGFRLKAIENPVRGYSTGLNLGFEHSACEYVCYLSADCIPNSDWLECLVRTMQAAGERCGVVQGNELPTGDSEIMRVISAVHTAENGKIDQKIEYFSNTNALYRKAVLNRFMPFVGINQRGGGEDTMMSIRFSDAGVIAMKSGSATVRHEMYESMEEFCKRTRVHGRSLLGLFAHHPMRPRIYLNSFYWGCIEIFKGVCTADKGLFNIGWLRLKHTVLGMLGF